jgi:ABC-type phosphate transport system auxiliary subunit
MYEGEVALRTIFQTNDQELIREWAGLRYGTQFERRGKGVAEVSRSVRIDIEDVGDDCPPNPTSQLNELRLWRLQQVEVQEEKRREEKMRSRGELIRKMQDELDLKKKELDKKEKTLEQARAALYRKSQQIQETPGKYHRYISASKHQTIPEE